MLDATSSDSGLSGLQHQHLGDESLLFGVLTTSGERGVW